jgi:hypothetical protein
MFLKGMAAVVAAPLALKSVVAAPAASTGVTIEQCMELGAATLKDMPKMKWVNYYASYNHDMTEIYRGKIKEKIRKETDKIKRRTFEDSGNDRCAEVARDHLFVGKQGMSDGGWPTSIPRHSH